MTRSDSSPRSSAPTAEKAVSPRRAPLAWILALAYTLLIAYASLQPFRDWRQPPAEVLFFLAAPWPRYITLDDVLINIAAYVPLGFLVALALTARVKAPLAVLLAALLALAFSIAMETVQAFIATRIASKVDVLANSAGGLLGALATPLLSAGAFPARRLAAWRARVFAPDSITDAGLVVAALWLATHLHPTAQLFGTGDLRATFELSGRLAHTPQLLISAEAVIVFFNLLGLGLLMATLVREPLRAFAAVASAVALALFVKSAAGVLLFDAHSPLAWLTPGVGLGLATGVLLLYPLSRLSRMAMSALALFCLVAAVAAINLAPGNPYQTVSPRLVAASATQLLRFSNIARALSELWPFLAAAYLAAAMLARARAR